MNHRTKAILVGLMLGAVACGEQSKDIVEPQLGGKADSLNSVQEQATMELGSVVEGAFTEDATFLGYRFYAESTGEVTAEITQRGSSRGLDTTLFLFGRHEASWHRVAFDDDAGWGPLSKVEQASLEGFDEFMLVVGTANGIGRGNFRLSLECTNDACIDDTPVRIEGCTDELYELASQCVQNQLENADWGWDDPAEEWSIEYCIEDNGVVEHAEWDCEPGNPNTRLECALSEEPDVDALDECGVRLKQEYNIMDEARLGRLAMSDELEFAALDFAESATDWAYRDMTGYTVLETTGPRQVAAATRDGRASNAHVGEVQSRSDYLEQRYLEDANRTLVSAIESEYGTGYVVVEMSANYYVAAGAEEWVDVDVLYYQDAAVAFSLVTITGED